MSAILQTYESLLTDASSLTGFSEIRGSCDVELEWLTDKAPLLEQQLLGCIESGASLSLDDWPSGLHRLAKASTQNAYALRILRQLLLFCYKASVTPSDTKLKTAYDNFCRVNEETRVFSNSLGGKSPTLLARAKQHVTSVLSKLKLDDLSFSHGPGAVTTCKDRWTRCYETIGSKFCLADTYCLYFNRDHAEQLPECMSAHIAAKLIDVPKDARGPRLICVHPAEAIWVQQGLRRSLERAIGAYRFARGPWPRGHVNFDDQTVNGRIALLSSRSRRYATIDMKEASDRISDQLVQILFGSWYSWFGSCRAQKVEIPYYDRKGQVYDTDLHCYAAMGNATTFPVQSLVFWAICVASLQRQGLHQPGSVFVFGDDIIVPSAAAEEVINDLESFGLVVNRRKSFYRGAFRESCGVDAFNGVNVSPIRWKLSLYADTLPELQALSDLGMRLRMSGYHEASVTVYAILRTRLSGFGKGQLFTTVNPNHGQICEYVESESCAWRDAYWHSSLQKFVSPTWRLVADSFEKQHDWNHVLSSILGLQRTGIGSEPARDVSRRQGLVRGWTELCL
jgi:hypothetical protein